MKKASYLLILAIFTVNTVPSQDQQLKTISRPYITTIFSSINRSYNGIKQALLKRKITSSSNRSLAAFSIITSLASTLGFIAKRACSFKKHKEHTPRITQRAKTLNIDTNQPITLVEPFHQNGKYFTLKNDPSFNKREHINHAIDSIFIGILTKIKDVGCAIKQRINRKADPNGNASDNWSQTPTFNTLTPDEQPKITWLGHSTFLIQANGIAILTDAIFGNLSLFYKRQVPPINPEELPHIDILLLSHNHRDHMDEQSLLAIRHHQPLILVPKDNGQWFKRNGFKHVVEKKWWEQHTVSFRHNEKEYTTDITCVPAQHWSTRYLLFGTNNTLCAGWNIKVNDDCNIYFAGDTGYNKTYFEQIKKVLKSPNIALLPIGPNEPRIFMDDAHLSTEQAVQAAIDLKAKITVPMHWATFGLGTESRNRPIKKLKQLIKWRKSELEDQQFLTGFKVGQSLSLT